MVSDDSNSMRVRVRTRTWIIKRDMEIADSRPVDDDENGDVVMSATNEKGDVVTSTSNRISRRKASSP